MKKPNGFAVLMLIAALPAAALNWNQGDLVSQGKSSFSAAPAAPAAVLVRPPSNGGGVAGQFDTYVFSLQWSAAFCEGKPALPECADRTPGRFSSRNLTIHGLWPNKTNDASHTYGYCGVDDATRALDRAATWCRMPDLGLSNATRGRLNEVMPGAASCLEKHEWYKHGSCSGFSPDEYYNRTADLVLFVSTTKFGRYLSANTGRTVAADDLLA
ncbi:MAG: hypothetical protein ABL955_13365, partial [Elusimicrobiota bacterium]